MKLEGLQTEEKWEGFAKKKIFLNCFLHQGQWNHHTWTLNFTVLEGIIEEVENALTGSKAGKSAVLDQVYIEVTSVIRDRIVRALRD